MSEIIHRARGWHAKLTPSPVTLKYRLPGDTPGLIRSLRVLVSLEMLPANAAWHRRCRVLGVVGRLRRLGLRTITANCSWWHHRFAPAAGLSGSVRRLTGSGMVTVRDYFG